MDEAGCPQCNHLRALALSRGWTYEKAHCIRCRPTGPRPKAVGVYLALGALIFVSGYAAFFH
jgi:hypothetical protein